jgi:hypothetical protein
VQGANLELDGAVKKAKAARRKKFYCLGICGEYPYSSSICLIVLTRFSANHHHHRCGGGRGCRSHQVSLEVPVFPFQHADISTHRH